MNDFSNQIDKISKNDPSIIKFAILINKKNELSKLTILLNVLNLNTNLKILHIINRKFDQYSLKLLGNFIKSNKSIFFLNLSYSKMIVSETTYLADALLENKTIEKLSMCYCELNSKSIKYFTKALEKNTSIKFLDFSDNKIEDKGLEYICNLLTVNNIVEELKLVKIGIRNIDCLSKIIETNNSLKNLDLKNNGCVSDYSSLFLSLKVNTKLEKLKIQFGVTNESMLILADTLRVNKTLNEIKIDYCDLDRESIDYFTEAIKANVGLKLLKVCCKTLELQEYFRLKVGGFIKIDFYTPSCYARLC